MSLRDAMERKEQFKKYYDRRGAQLREMGQVIEQWMSEPPDEGEQDGEGYYESVGRLKARLAATRSKLETFRSRPEGEHVVRRAIDEAISDLERALAEAGPRGQ